MAKHSEHIQTQLDAVSRKIKALRKEKGFKNYEFFAYEHEISRSQYWRYENGEDMRLSTLLKLLEIHGLTLQEFCNEGFLKKEV